MKSEMDNGSSSWGSSIGTLLLGACIGAAVAILYTPRSGNEVRAQLTDTANQMKDKAMDLKSLAVEKAEQVKEMAASKVQQMGGQAGDMGAQARQSADRVADTLRE